MKAIFSQIVQAAPFTCKLSYNQSTIVKTSGLYFSIVNILFHFLVINLFILSITMILKLPVPCSEVAFSLPVVQTR